MNYEETVQYLYDCVPMFQKIGSGGYKEGLDNTLAFDEHLNHPHQHFKTIHIAGTNGKGSCSHTIAAILQAAGYRVGLYTSPHLIDFRERIRVNGVPVSQEFVVRFVEEERDFFEPLSPSFFEVTTAMAFKYFKEQEVDVAVIEVGLGGRLDCTNIITPVLSVITNISFDHTQFLGHTLAEIASEKAGIIKPAIPVVVGETVSETKPVFATKAKGMQSEICFAEESNDIISSQNDCASPYIIYNTKHYGEIHGQLSGLCQEKNARTILAALPYLAQAGFCINKENVQEGFARVCELTGLMGRWQIINQRPLAICDTGHNEGGFRYISEQLKRQQCKSLRIVFGMVNDKDITTVLSMLPKHATYYFTKADIHRALNENELMDQANTFSLHGQSYPTVIEAYRAAINDANEADFIFVGGSSYVVADLLSSLKK